MISALTKGWRWDGSLWGVYAVWRRHASVYQQTWMVNCLLPVSEPIVYLFAFGYGLTPLIPEIIYLGQPFTYVKFIGPAMIGIALLFQSFFEGAYASFIRLHYQKTWHALMTAPLSFQDVFFGDWCWAATRGLIAGLITGLVTTLLGFYPWTGLLGSLPFMILGCFLFAAMGLLTTGLARTIDHVNVPIFLLLIPMFTLCGTYFPRENLPPWMHGIAAALPLSPMVDLLRWPLVWDPWWVGKVLFLLLCTLVIGRLAYRTIQRKLFND
ncbi:MAG: ABC transporter permease [Synechococcales cyanobacterium]